MANLVEVFSGIQGEGDLVGYRQIFLRFSACQINCAYCDTDFAHKDQARLEVNPGIRDFIMLDNPISARDLARHIGAMNDKLKHHSVSLTGGEPLLHAGYLADLLVKLRAQGLRIYLETNGLLVEELAQIIDLIDIVGMDIKLESSTAEPTDWQRHGEFLKLLNKDSLAGEKIQTFVKIVVSKDSSSDEIERVAQVMRDSGHERTSLIIQPVTPTHGVRPPDPNQLLEIMNQAINLGLEARVIPQTHVILSQL